MTGHRTLVREIRPDQHGTRTGYRAGCDCPPCVQANANAVSALRRRRAYGRPSPHDRVDPATAIAAANELRTHGLSDTAIAQLSGLNSPSVYRLRTRNPSYVTRETHERILAALQRARGGYQPTPHLVPSAHAWQMLRSLAALGWPLSWQTQQLGYTGDHPPFERALMTRENYDRVHDLYDRYSGSRGPSAVTARYAARQGWYTPLAYDDHGNLLPDAVLVRRKAGLRLRDTREGMHEQILQLTAKGWSAQRIADALDVTSRTVQRVRAAARTPDVTDPDGTVDGMTSAA